MPNYIPSCARCGSKAHVDTNVTKWVENPKILHGTRSHRYFDTKCYSCNSCKSSFLAWHPDTLKADAQELAGILNFRFSHGFVVDDELYSTIVVESQESTAAIHQKHRQMIAHNYIMDATLHYRAIMLKRVKPYSRVVEGTNQSTLDTLLVPVDNEPAARRMRRTREDLIMVERSLRLKQSSFNAPVHFSDIFQRKADRNATGLPFKGIGKSKCTLLISKGILTTKDLLAYDGDDPTTLPQWKTIVQNYYDNLEVQVASLLQRQKSLIDDLSLDEFVERHTDARVPTAPVGQDAQPPAEEKHPPFSRLNDTVRYNARYLSKSSIDRIKITDFERRKPMLVAKMSSIKCACYKIDWHYKLPSKIKVYRGKGKSFKPYKSAVTIQNEDGLTVFWKFYPSTESMTTLAPDLERLQMRNRNLGGESKCTWVDNCCTVEGKLKSVLGQDHLVKLDVFHWQCRWDPIMVDLQSEKTTVFRSLMRRALFMCEPHEYERVRQELEDAGKPYTPREVLKIAKSTIPPPRELEKRVMSVLHAIMDKDHEIDQERTANADASEKKEQRFFKRGAETLNIIANQMSHVRKGCLSDPPSAALPMFRINPTTGKACAARSTGTNEVDNRYLNHLLDSPSIGLTRADMTIWSYCDGSNDRKRVNRLGEAPQDTTRTDQLQALCGLATQCGHGKEDIPIPSPNFPRLMVGHDEYMGFEHELPSEMQEDEINSLDDENTVDSEESVMDLLCRVDDDDDENENPLDDASDIFAMDVDVDLSIYTPEIIKKESTYETYMRLTQERPWVPFKHPRDIAEFTDVDTEEMVLFDSMSPSYDRHGKFRLDAARGYGSFARAWNIEAGNRYKAQLDGQEDVVLVNRKTYLQLQEHFDIMEKQKELARLQSKTDPNMREMEATFKATRSRMLPHQHATCCRPVDYNNTNITGRAIFGVPYALNATVAANAFQHNPQSHQNAPILFRQAQQLGPVKTFTRKELGANFKAKTYCWRCGYQRKTHIRFGIPFGNDCHSNCLFDQCSKCGWRIKECHAGSAYGPHCPRDTSETSTVAGEWFK